MQAMKEFKEMSYQPSFGNFLCMTTGAAVTGLIIGAIIGAPAALTAGVFAVSSAATSLSQYAITSLAEKYNWEKSNVKLLRALTDVILGTALIVAAVSLGIFGSTAATVFGVCFGIAFLSDLSEAAALQPQRQQFIRV